MAWSASRRWRIDSSRQMGVRSRAWSSTCRKTSSYSRGCSIISRLNWSSFRQVVEVGQAVGGVGVHHERDRGKALADGGHDVEVPTRLDLDLDPLVSRLQLLLDLAQENVGVILDADGDAAGDPAMASPQKLPQGHSRRLGLEIPERRLQTGLGHGMPPHRSDPARKLVRPAEADIQHPRDQEPAQDRPDGVHRLIAESWRIVGDTLTPAGEPVRPDFRPIGPGGRRPGRSWSRRNGREEG